MPAWLSVSDTDGAVVTFTGKVHKHNFGAETLEHCPSMIEKALAEIVAPASVSCSLE
ncbi:MAG: Molybdopterin synthase catalytic subunit [Sodalis sp.]|nr:MAG: Molybdopterin synthase catalytic subunit [Sodalis sp.]